MKKKWMLLLVNLLIFICLASAQQKSTTGMVISDEDGEPIIGASILVKGTTLGTISDMNGKFTLNGIPPNAQTLNVSYVGMITQEIGIKPSLRIILRTDVQQVDEVLVVAFGEQKKSSFTGSAGVMKADKIGIRQVTNAIDALTGKVAGVQMIAGTGGPGGTPTIRIRGFSSINAGNDPLIVVDGSPYDGGWNSINPSDVESMTVLKDAASNALYGARGANGVIMITTKKAKKGEATITLDAKWGVNSDASVTYDYIKAPRAYYEAHYASLHNYYTRAKAMSPSDAHIKSNQLLGAPASEGGLDYMTFTAPQGQYLIDANGKFNPAATEGYIHSYNGQEFMLKPDSWFEEGFKNSLRQEYNINISGGNDKADFYASFGYLDNPGIIEVSKYTRYSARLKASYQAKPWLKVGGNVNYTNYESNSVNTGTLSIFGSAVTLAPIYPIYIRDGQGTIMTDNNGPMYDWANGQVIGIVRTNTTNNNPIQENKLNTYKSEGNSFNFNGFADVSFLKYFKATLNATASDHEYRYTSAKQPFYGYSASLGGTLSKSHYRTMTFNFQQLLNFSRSFGNHSVSALVGHESYTYNYAELSGSKNKFYSYFDNQELNGTILKNSQSSSTTDYNTEGYFLRGQYDYQSKYFLSASYRRDASSRFHPDNRWGNFWSAGGAWILTKESWFPKNNWVDMLKLKVSYGSQGNDDIGYYRYVDTYDISESDGKISLVFNSKGNKDITWETNGNLNAGVEFELFKGRLTGGIDFFSRKTTDMLTWLSTPKALGYSGYYDNIGDMKNTGVEIELNGGIIKTKNFTWDVNVNMTQYSNEITYLADDKKATTIEGYSGYIDGSYFYAEGLPLYSWRLKKYAGVSEQGESMWYRTNDQGEMETTTTSSKADYYLCGTPMPKLYGGFGTALSLYGVDVNLTFTYSIGGQSYDGQYATYMGSPTPGYTGGNIHKDIYNAWSEDNTASNIPRWQYNDTYSNAASDRWLTNASWLKLQNINIGYSLPSKWLKTFQVNKVRVYMACDNICYWSKRKGFNPSNSFSGETSSMNYSPIRTISGGLNIQF